MMRAYMFQSAMRIFCCSNNFSALLEWVEKLFQSAMRIFCCSNTKNYIVYGTDAYLFQSAMRIFCCSNLGR